MDLLRPFYGRIVKDYGQFSRRKYFLFAVTISATLRERRGRRLLLLSERWIGLGFAVRWVELDLDAVGRLDLVLQDVMDQSQAK
jgi:hypothetical protein